MTMNMDNEVAEKILDAMKKNRRLYKLVHKIIGENRFLLDEVMSGYTLNVMIDFARTVKSNDEITSDQLIDKAKHLFDEYYEELSRKSDRDIHIMLEEFLSDYSNSKSTEVYSIFNLVLHWMNSMGISPIFATKFSDRKELRMKIEEFICYYFDFVLYNSPEDIKKQDALDLYGVVIMRNNLRELAIDFLMEDFNENNKSVSAKNEVSESVSSNAKEESSIRRKEKGE